MGKGKGRIVDSVSDFSHTMISFVFAGFNDCDNICHPALNSQYLHDYFPFYINRNKLIKSVLYFQVKGIQRNSSAFLLIVATAMGVLYVGYRHDTLKQSVAYLLVMWLCSFFIDLFAIRKPPANDFVIRNPKRETIYFFVLFFLGILFFYIRFSGIVDWQNLNHFIRLATIPLILCVYPVALAIVMLLLKYKPGDLGLRIQGLMVIIPVIIISAVINRLICPEQLTYDTIIGEGGGVLGALFTGFILAGLSEEFFRVIGQTRLGALINNKGLAWFIITFCWAFMHFPKWYSEDHNITDALLGSIRIIPIGLMWGYMTHRTKSFLPSIIVHGSNYWGLQNF